MAFSRISIEVVTINSKSLFSTIFITSLRPSQLPTSPPRTRRFSFANPRTLGELGCTQSLLPPVAACHLSPHLSLNARAFSGISQGNILQNLSNF
ncbi:hypothetical protein MKX03_026578 [Papaver bracteatum]|nr:hypothetical protein MKX03_026578 [Papaver bracteatum]